MTPPPSAFAQAFRQHVIPRLRDRIGAFARPVYYGGMTFSQAMAELTGEAHGATYLEKPIFDQFQDWLCAELTRHIGLLEKVIADLDRCEAEAVRWLEATPPGQRGYPWDEAA